MRNLLIWLLLAPPLQAQELMSLEEFAAFADGQVLGFSVSSGDLYGTERYLPGQRVLWSTPNGRCTGGDWFARGDRMCFRYDDAGQDRCWLFFRTGDTITGMFEWNWAKPIYLEVIDETEMFACGNLS